jgi:hypothetical protein
MAGDWIAMRLDLYEDPAVTYMAEQLGQREEVVVGYLHRIWAWASRQCHDGSVTNVTLMSLGRVTSLPNFPDLMVQAGWLEHGIGDDGRPFIRFPNWERWMAESAKKRLLAAKRQSKKRHATVTKMSRSERDESVTRGEERREERDTTKSGISLARPTIEQVAAYCQERGGKVDPQAWMDHYTANGWRVGRNPMKDWKAAVRQWERNELRGGNGKPASKPVTFAQQAQANMAAIISKAAAADAAAGRITGQQALLEGYSE